jgi:hypothetical protein
MVETYDVIDADRNLRTAENKWDSPLVFGPDSNTRSLVRALLSEADRIDSDLESIYAAQHINSSSGQDLDKWGRLVNVQRQTGEADDKYRARIKAEFRQGTMGTTFNQFAEYCATVLSTDVQNLSFTFNEAEAATVTLSADGSIYSNVNLTNQDVQSIIEDGVPAGHEVNVIEEGTFRLIEDGDTNDPSKGLTSDSTSDGGTLSEDIVQ